MTFADWYAANVKPQLEETLKTMPVTAREALRTASRQAFAGCWNAALEAGDEMLTGKLVIAPGTLAHSNLRSGA